MVTDTEHGRSKTTILVVDDDSAVRDSLKFLLELEGFQVRIYRNGEELLNDNNTPRDACLVIDQVMPGRPGLEIIDAIRLRGGREPAVLVVSEPSLMVRRGAARRGVTVVEKPFLEHTLIDVIRSAIARPS